MKIKIKFAFKLIMAICGILATIGLASGCGPSDAKQKPAEAVLRPVKAIQLSSPAANRKLNLPGVAKAVRDTNLSFRVGGPLITLRVDTGAYVEKGQVVAEIDPRDFQIRVNTSKAKLNSSSAQLAEAKLQYDRYAKLIKTKAVAQAEYDRVKASFEVASAQHQSDAKALEDAKNALADTVLKAPFSGVIDERFVDNHEKVQQGQPIVSLVDITAMEVNLALSEDLMPLTNDFASFNCVFDALPGRSFKAALKEVGQKANAASRTYPLILSLDKSAVSLVRPGMSAEVTVGLSDSDDSGSYVVPLTALANKKAQETIVWVVDENSGRLSQVPVKLMGLRDAGAEIKGSLTDGQWIVTAGVGSLRPDMVVRLLDKAAKTNIGVEM